MKNQLFLFFASCVLLLSSCGDNYIIKESKMITDSKWLHEDAAEFPLVIEDTTALYTIYIDIEHLDDYTYQNIYLRISTKFPSDENLQKLLSLDLANEAGQWLGDCSGEQCIYRASLQENAFFEKAGTYIFTIEQYMRDNPLPSIGAITFLVEKVGKR